MEKLIGIEPGKALLPGDGEGRNAVYCAQKGWKVSAFDLSMVGKQKADLLARESHLQIDFRVGDVEDIQYPENSFDALILIFAHFDYELRNAYHKKLSSFLKPGGILILEGFSRPEDSLPDIRYDLNEIRSDFENYKFSELRETTVFLNEGFVINGTAKVVQAFGKKAERGVQDVCP